MVMHTPHYHSSTEKEYQLGYSENKRHAGPEAIQGTIITLNHYWKEYVCEGAHGMGFYLQQFFNPSNI